MKLRIFMLIFVLILTLSVSAVYAQETVTEEAPAQEPAAEEAPAEEGSLDGFLKSLFGNVLEEVLPAGTDLDGMISAAGEQLGQAESELGSVFSSLVEKAKSEGIEVNVDSLKDYAVSFLSGMGGAGDFNFGLDLDAYMAMMESIRAAEEQYYKDHNAGLMDPGEIQI
ncbi:MAG: hypothetical protein IKP86_01680, partial [Anaerolineaceae bacterium]|nr:hypothetical protein [Anaerolineaceae bacterium]